MNVSFSPKRETEREACEGKSRGGRLSGGSQLRLSKLALGPRGVMGLPVPQFPHL